MASLIIISGKQKGEYLPLGQRTSVIGRAEMLSLQILDDGVSRKHFRVFYDKETEKYYAEDMKSRHGTLINMRRITEKKVLTEGDHIQIGGTRLLFTDKDFDTKENALLHFKQRGEKAKTTRMNSEDTQIL